MNDIQIYTAIEQRQQAVELIEAGMVLVEKAGKYEGVLNDTDAAVVSELRARLNGHIKRVDDERLEMTKGARDAQKRINDQFSAKIAEMTAALKQVDAVLGAHMRAKQEAERREREAREAEQRRIREEEERRQREADEQRRAAERAQAEAEAAARAAQEAAARAAERGSARAQAEAAKAARDAAARAEAAAKAEADRLAAERAAEEERRRAEESRQQLAATPIADSGKRVAGSFGSKTTMRDNWTYRIVDITKVPEAFLVAPEQRVQKATLNAMARSQKAAASVPGIEFYNDPTIQSREAV